MNEVLNAIKTRRSVRCYSDRIPTDEQIEAVMDAGIQAATGRNSQSVIIVAIKDRKIRDEYALANASVMGTTADPFYGAPIILAVLVRADAPCVDYDGPIALGNMMLAAHSLGLGSCWIHRAKEVFAEKRWKDLLAELGVTGEYIGVGNLALGYISGEYPAEKEKNQGRKLYV